MRLLDDRTEGWGCLPLDACIALKDFPAAPFIQRTIYVTANAKADENVKAIKPSMIMSIMKLFVAGKQNQS